MLKKKRGRPPLADPLMPITIRFTREQRKRLQAEAGARGITITELIRERSLQQCKPAG